MDQSDVTYIPEPEEPRRDGTVKVLLIIAGVGVLSLILCCGAGGAMFYFMSVRFAELGEMLEDGYEEEFSNQAADELRDNLVMQEHIGEIEEFTMDWDASMEAPGVDEYVFHVRGNKGEGTLRADCITVNDYKKDVVAGTLEMEDGATYNLFPDEP